MTRTAWEIETVRSTGVDRLRELVQRGNREGFRFLRRLEEEWRSGANRFDRPGEALF